MKKNARKISSLVLIIFALMATMNACKDEGVQPATPTNETSVIRYIGPAGASECTSYQPFQGLPANSHIFHRFHRWLFKLKPIRACYEA